MKTYKFTAGEPEDGTLVLGVVYYIGREAQIFEAVGIEPIGYVVEVESPQFEIGEPEREE